VTTIRQVAENLAGLSRRELVVHVAAAGLGLAFVSVVLADAGAGLLVRGAALPLALSLVVHGLLGVLALGRAEWRRAAPRRADYLRVVVRFAVAFVLAGLAAS